MEILTKHNSREPCNAKLWDVWFYICSFWYKYTTASEHVTLLDIHCDFTQCEVNEPGQYLDGRPPGQTKLLLEDVLVRPAGGAHPSVCVGPNTLV